VIAARQAPAPHLAHHRQHRCRVPVIVIALRRRDVTLTSLAASTGISKSTVSRLENGQRKPSLQLLLPLAHAFRVPLDDLVGAPDVADPRVRLKPHQRKGRTVIPLARHPGGLQTWKIVAAHDAPANLLTKRPRM